MLYLVRHAHALNGLNDAARPLSPKGRDQVKRLGKFLRAGGGLAPDQIWHSPLVRARETAVLLARALRTKALLRSVAGLRAEDDPRVIARRVAKAARSLALVGHEPHLSALASLLVTGEAEPPVFEMKKCGVLALERATGRWVVRWLLSPDIVG